MPDTNQSNTTSQGKSAFSGSSSTNKSDRLHYNTPAIQVGNEVRDGDEFVLVTRSRQSDGFQIWSSADKDVTEQLYRQAATQLLDMQTT